MTASAQILLLRILRHGGGSLEIFSLLSDRLFLLFFLLLGLSFILVVSELFIENTQMNQTDSKIDICGLYLFAHSHLSMSSSKSDHSLECSDGDRA